MRIKHLSNHLLIVICCFIASSCGTTKKAGSSIDNIDKIEQIVEGCNAVVTVRNYTHEAGCQYLFELPNGKLLLPGVIGETSAPFYDGAGLKIGYEILNKSKNDVTEVSCKSHDYIIKVTCVEQYIIPKKGVPTKHEDCKPINNPYKMEWMRTTITKLKPSKVQEYPYTIGYLYQFINSEGSYLYDCLGNEVCKTMDGPDCNSLIETLSAPKVILVMNN